MKFFDITTMAIHNLWQRRFRTALNLIGVVIGCIVLLMTSAGISGVKDAFQVLFDSSEFARQIEIYRSWNSKEEPPEGTVVVEGEMSDERRERIRESLVQRWKAENTDRLDELITKEDLDTYAGWKHVRAVVPHAHITCTVTVGDETTGSHSGDSGDDSADTTVSAESNSRDFETVETTATAAGPPSDSIARSLLTGEMISDDDHGGAIIHEFLAYKLGYRSDRQLEQLVGKQLNFEWKIAGKASSMFHMFSGYAQKLTPEDLSNQLLFVQAFKQIIADLDKTSLTDAQKQMIRDLISEPDEAQREIEDVFIRRTFTIRGVYRRGANQSFSSVFYQQLSGEQFEVQLHREVVRDLQLENPEQQYFYGAVVIVDSSRNLREVTEKLEETGARVFSSLSVIESINYQIESSGWVVYGIAAAILLTAMIGISNTLIISVMERTPEFGVMKALGARDGDLVLLMISEGAILGAIGAVMAVLFSWTLSFGVQILLEMYIENQISGDISSTLFRFTALPILLTTVIAIVVCILASVAPAIRAARLDPVVAMRRT